MEQKRYTITPSCVIQLVATLFVATWAPLAMADTDYQRARELMQAGEILPLEQVLSAINRERNWQLLEAELEEEDEQLVYEFEFITPEGEVREIRVDARTAQPISEADQSSNHKKD